MSALHSESAGIALDAIDVEIADAREKVGRLVRRMRSNAEDLHEDASDVGLVGYPKWTPTEEALALQCARVYLAGLNAAWAAVARAYSAAEVGTDLSRE